MPSCGRRPAPGCAQLIVSLSLSALLVTHDQIEAMAIADHITLLNSGPIEQEGSPIELYSEPATVFAAEFMGNNNRLEGTLVENADNRAVIEVKGGAAGRPRAHQACDWREGDRCHPPGKVAPGRRASRPNGFS